jgi:hypothetical protein
MIDHSVLHSLQDHLRIGMHDLDHPIVCQCKKLQQESYNPKQCIPWLQVHTQVARNKN